MIVVFRVCFGRRSSTFLSRIHMQQHLLLCFTRCALLNSRFFSGCVFFLHCVLQANFLCAEPLTVLLYNPTLSQPLSETQVIFNGSRPTGRKMELCLIFESHFSWPWQFSLLFPWAILCWVPSTTMRLGSMARCSEVFGFSFLQFDSFPISIK